MWFATVCLVHLATLGADFDHAHDRNVIQWSHFGVMFFGLFSAAFCTALHYGGVNLGWTIYMLGVLMCPRIFPTCFAILWKRQTKIAAVISPVLGLATGIAVWLGTAKAYFGSTTVASTGDTLPCVFGTVASAFSPALYSIILSTVFPSNYEWKALRLENLAFAKQDTLIANGALHQANVANYGDDKNLWERLKRWGVIAAIWAAATFIGHWVLWPLPMYGSNYVFSKNFGISSLRGLLLQSSGYGSQC